MKLHGHHQTGFEFDKAGVRSSIGCARDGVDPVIENLKRATGLIDGDIDGINLVGGELVTEGGADSVGGGIVVESEHRRDLCEGIGATEVSRGKRPLDLPDGGEVRVEFGIAGEHKLFAPDTRVPEMRIRITGDTAREGGDKTKGRWE